MQHAFTDDKTAAIAAVSRAYVSCEMHEYDRAIQHLRDGATYAWLAGDIKRHFAIVKAHATLLNLMGRRHLASV